MTPASESSRPRVRVVDSIRLIQPEAWDELSGADPQLSHGWLRTMEDQWVEDVERHYILLENGHRLVGAAACYVDEPRARAESVDDFLFGRLRDTAVGRALSLRPALVCGFPWSVGPGCIIEPGSGAAQRRERLEILVEAVTQASRGRLRGAAFLGVTDGESELLRVLRARGYRRVRHEPMYELELEWSGFEAYRRSLPSKNIRKNIRRELNNNRRQGVEITEIEDPAGCEERLHELVDRHFRRFGWAAFPYGVGWFRALKSNLGRDAVISVARTEDAVIGIAVSLRKQRTRQMILVCIDHAAPGHDLTHFNLSYYWPVGDCIRRGDRRYVVGPGQHTSRSRRGYRPVASYVYCRPRGAGRRLVTALWLGLLSAWLRHKAA